MIRLCALQINFVLKKKQTALCLICVQSNGHTVYILFISQQQIKCFSKLSSDKYSKILPDLLWKIGFDEICFGSMSDTDDISYSY